MISLSPVNEGNAITPPISGEGKEWASACRLREKEIKARSSSLADQRHTFWFRLSPEPRRAVWGWNDEAGMTSTLGTRAR